MSKNCPDGLKIIKTKSVFKRPIYHADAAIMVIKTIWPTVLWLLWLWIYLENQKSGRWDFWSNLKASMSTTEGAGELILSANGWAWHSDSESWKLGSVECKVEFGSQHRRYSFYMLPCSHRNQIFCVHKTDWAKWIVPRPVSVGHQTVIKSSWICIAQIHK